MAIRFKLVLFFVITHLLLAAPVSARIILDITITYKKEIDNDLVLTSELHSKEYSNGKDFISLKMKNGFIIKILANFYPDKDQYGPSSLIYLQRKLYDSKDNLFVPEDNTKIIFKLGEHKTLLHRGGNDQLIELKVRPYLGR